MSAKRSLLVLVAATTVGGFAACNQTVGECWYYGEGTENAGASVGPGGGMIIPTGPAGVGGSGNEPPEPESPQGGANSELKCNSDEEPDKEQPDEENVVSSDDNGSYEAGLKVFCLKADHGAICSERCMNKGVGCVPLAVHPYKTDGGIGKLYACNTLLLGFMCSYAYPNGDSCNYAHGNPFPNTCTYTGKD
ncbi:MAG TPA: hypothetical protein VEX38_09685 [Fimbriimonadaceae bacterium]|jgi:hypothetical protein|nr:hypothetical protein [Fimbriimonadaceae bacterium]